MSVTSCPLTAPCLWPGRRELFPGCLTLALPGRGEFPPASLLFGGVPTEEPGFFPREELTSPSHPNLAGWWASSLSSPSYLQAITWIAFQS